MLQGIVAFFCLGLITLYFACFRFPFFLFTFFLFYVYVFDFASLFHFLYHVRHYSFNPTLIFPKQVTIQKFNQFNIQNLINWLNLYPFSLLFQPYPNLVGYISTQCWVTYFPNFFQSVAIGSPL